jgi:hypothetical protein
VKIPCTLGINFFLYAIYNHKYASLPIDTSKTQPISNWQVHDGLFSAFSNWKTKKLRSMPVRQFLRNLKTQGAIIAAFTNEK